jgi:hypothetical protein
MLHADPLKTHLPPSGARPWSRFRQGSMHGTANLFNGQTLADITPPFGGAASWAVRINDPEQGMNFAQSQGMPLNAPPVNNPFSSPGFPPAQQQPGPGFPPPEPVSPQSQPYPPYPANPPFTQMRPVSGFPAPEPVFPPQGYPPQQGFPPAQPNAGFFPTNTGNGDIALALDAASMSSIDTGSLAKHKPSPIRLRGLDSSSTDDRPVIPDTPQIGLEMNSEELPSLDDPMLRNTLNRFMQRGKSAREGEQSNET